jgi:23S rRNA (cytosine1962-C5)-methyltransferase
MTRPDPVPGGTLNRLAVAEPWEDYQLIDIGAGRKLERFGTLTVDRPEPQALWARSAPDAVWKTADMKFNAPEDQESGTWERSSKAGREDWQMRFDEVRFACRATSFRHVGVFPEQASHWRFISERLSTRSKPNVLNLFGYTGVASLVAAAAGAEVTHIDASKKAIAWARENQALSGLDKATIRWICDDALKFAERDVRRGKKYDAIILDPPMYGRGPDNEVWHFFEDLPKLLDALSKLISDTPAFVLISAYALRLSSVSLAELLKDYTPKSGMVEAGELAVAAQHGGRLFSTSLYARWLPEKERA